ncbi:amino acid transporter AVT6C-like [Amaranthus tricolor]|uniref:amino acid transporter AVT6C-like n=1 Tax=Amaranthus tricolor TaxID=29722 RepID=UPI0025908EB5|nr:amino acid transporter AVT6C-like [Amaranthus tricolor]
MTSDAGVPLLPTNSNNDIKISDKASISGAVFNVSTTMVGAGIMSIPATFKVLGVFSALFLIVVVAFLADLSANFLLRFTNSDDTKSFSGETMTYGGVMKESFGSIGSLLVQISVIITNWGCLVVYLIILGDVFCGSERGETLHLGILQEWFGSQWWNTRPYALLAIVVCVLLPLVLFRRVESLKYSSALSILLAVFFVCISLVMAISALIQGKTEKPRLFPDLNGQFSFFNLFTAVPVIVTAFTFHFNVLPITSELGNPSKMEKALKISLILCVAIYFSIGLFGYLLFGDTIASDILVNFDRSSESPLLNDVVRLSYALHLVLVYPMVNFPLRLFIDELVFPKKPVLANDNFRFFSLTSVILSLSYLAAIVIPDIWIFFQYVGSTAIVLIVFIFPAAITLRDVRGIFSLQDQIIAVIMVILAVLTSTISISTNIYSGSES